MPTRLIIEVDTEYEQRFVGIAYIYDKDGFAIGTVHSIEEDD